MRRLFLATFIFLFPAFGITATRAFKTGYATTDTPTDLKWMHANPNGTAYYMTFEYPEGTDYVVPTGKTFYITHIISATSAANYYKLGYGDTGVANGNSAPTNAVFVTPRSGMPVATTDYPLDVFIPIPAGKYPFGYAVNGDVYIRILGIEVDN